MQQQNPSTFPVNSLAGREKSVRALLALSALMLGLHVLIWTAVIILRGRTWTQLLTGWDSGWYLKIIEEGYQGQAWAFYPAWPMLVKAFQWIPLHPVILGSLLATLLYLGILFLFIQMLRRSELFERQGLLPWNVWGWFFFIFSPSSFAFHSNHTESLYLLLTLLAWIACVQARWVLAAVACGLAALTKNQGVLLSISCALWMASLETAAWKKALRFVVFGLIAGGFFSLFLVWQWRDTGDPLSFLHVQSEWHPDISGLAYLKGLVMMNPWQALTLGTLIHHIFFVVLLIGAGLVWKCNRFVSLYLFSFILIEPLSGELVGTLRYGTVLAPAFFALARGRRGPLLWGVALLWLALNLAVTWSYGIGRWAY